MKAGRSIFFLSAATSAVGPEMTSSMALTGARFLAGVSTCTVSAFLHVRGPKTMVKVIWPSPRSLPAGAPFSGTHLPGQGRRS